ncbi:unnamed protein product, partial [Oikopleura dioica]
MSDINQNVQQGISFKSHVKRTRVPFLAHEKAFLEEKYRHCAYPSSEEYVKIAQQIGTTPKRVKGWFLYKRKCMGAVSARYSRESLSRSTGTSSHELQSPAPSLGPNEYDQPTDWVNLELVELSSKEETCDTALPQPVVASQQVSICVLQPVAPVTLPPLQPIPRRPYPAILQRNMNHNNMIPGFRPYNNQHRRPGTSGPVNQNNEGMTTS